MSPNARSMPAMAVARTIPWPCQKCWRYIICPRRATRVGSSPATRPARSAAVSRTGGRPAAPVGRYDRGGRGERQGGDGEVDRPLLGPRSVGDHVLLRPRQPGGGRQGLRDLLVPAAGVGEADVDLL